MPSTCECWFLDVGQGAANVILLGGGRAIVVDCGPRGSSETLQLLKTHVDFIEALIVTHNDSDHDFGVASILAAYPKAIGRILFLADRPAKEIGTLRALGLLMSEQKENYPVPERLEADGTEPKVIWSENDMDLTVVYPDFVRSLSAESAGTRGANRTSAVLRLSCGERSVVFSGDAPIETWEHICSDLQYGKSLVCDIMTVPHHGGKISSSLGKGAQSKLYTEIVRPEYGIISVGTSNIHGHPLPETIEALRNAGVTILCTQMTKRCCEDLESVRSTERVLFKPCRSTREMSTTNGGKSRNVACYSTIVAEISPMNIAFSSLRTPRRIMERLGSLHGFSGMCKRAN